MLPSLPALRAFDAAARYGSFRLAAEHLSVSPTAISHHIRGLEADLGTQLFQRTGRDVVLTEDGRRLAEKTVEAFGLLDEAVTALRRSARKVVRLSAGPIFTARWLMPRIGGFWHQHPDIELEVVPSYRPGTLGRDRADVVIRWERLADMPRDAHKLLELRPVAIASVDYVARYGPIQTPAHLIDIPILHQRDHWGWHDWFNALQVTPQRPLRGPVFEDANALLRGAAEGQGAVVGWLPLIEPDLLQGRVLRLFDEDIPPTHGYFVEPSDQGHARRETDILLKWLLAQKAAVS